MKGSSLTHLLLAAVVVALGLPVAANLNLPHTFAPGTPIRFRRGERELRRARRRNRHLGATKQDAVTGSPCGDGQFVRGILADGALECGVDQIGSAGAACDSSLNGVTGDPNVQGGSNVTISAEDNSIIVSAEDGTGTAGAEGPQGRL